MVPSTGCSNFLSEGIIPGTSYSPTILFSMSINPVIYPHLISKLRGNEYLILINALKNFHRSFRNFK